MNKIPLIRRSTPSLLASKLQAVIPISNENIIYETSQLVRVFDPGLCLTFTSCDMGDKVQIQRVIEHKQINGDNIIKLCNVHIIEIIKEYSFDEWDNGLKLIKK